MIRRYNTCLKLLDRLLHTREVRWFSQEMVTPRAIAAELLKKRKEAGQRGKNTLLNSAEIQVLGSNCQGHRPSLLVSSEGSAYLFNCAEGTQRNCYTHKVKLSSLGHLFITNLNWSGLSGAYGLSLTLQDLGAPHFVLHGTDGVTDFYNSVSSFLSFTSGIECRAQICTDDEYKDSSITVKPVILDLNRWSDCEEGDSKRVKRAPRLISYICALPDLPGPLDPQKCRELRVPIGPKLATLKSGCDITLDDGTVVKSSDVCGPKNRGMQLMIVDCPSVSDIDLVLKNEALNMHRETNIPRDDKQIDMVIHFSPKDVYENQRYIEWMDSFPANWRHVLLANVRPTRPNFIDAYRMQYLLNRIDNDLFPHLRLPEHLNERFQRELIEAPKTMLEYGVAEPDDLELKYETKGPLKSQERVYLASALDKFVIRPSPALQSAENRLLIDATLRNALQLPDFDEDLYAYDCWRKSQPEPALHEPEVVFLGTGSALPSKIRNTTCIVVNVNWPERAAIILDCGEDSYGQMIRFYGQEGTDELLRRLKLIYVSHHHADHHIGLIEILRRIKMLGRDDAVLLLIPPGVDTQLNYYNFNFEDLSCSYLTRSTRALKSKPSSGHVSDKAIESIVNLIRSRSNNLIRDIKVVGVDHCANACAVTMELNIGRPEMETFKISYSGDARPSEDFVMIGQDSDLLIHEATFDHRDANSALEKKHSTTTEAIRVSKDMRAKYTILTHFSQRYPKIPYFTDEFDDTIGYAFDNMAIKCPSHFARLPQMKKVLSNAFGKSLTEIDAKYSKMREKKKMIDGFLDNGT